MNGSPAKYALPHVAALHPYTPGLQPSEPGWIKLNTNECPYPPSPRVAAALRGEIGEDGASLRLYPNPRSAPLRAALAALHGVREEQVLVGNGSDEILTLLLRCFCSPEASLGFTVPSYSLYPVLVAIQNGSAEAIDFDHSGPVAGGGGSAAGAGTPRAGVQWDRALRLPVERIAGSGARAFLLTSPNAPTGVGFTNAELTRVLERFDGLLVVDEAYAPFARENAVPLLSRHPNLAIVRTLSKSHALAGVRVGYILAHPDIVGLLDRVRDSYNVSRLAQTAALAAIGDPGYYEGIIQKVRDTRDYYAHAWRTRRGWFTYPSEANFIFTEPREPSGRSGPAVAVAAYEFLRSRRILVRHFPSHALTASFLRISVGTDDEMLVLDETFDAWPKETPRA